MEATRHWMILRYAQRPVGIPEALIKQKFLVQKVPLHYTNYAIDLLVAYGYAKALGGIQPNRFFVPLI